MASRVFLIIVGFSGLLVVALGAYGAHGLQDVIGERLLETFKKAVTYQGTHTLALFGVAVLLVNFPLSRWLKVAGWSFIIGILLFSGSLYIMVFAGVHSLGLVTPLGGVVFMFGWFSLVLAAYKDISL